MVESGAMKETYLDHIAATRPHPDVVAAMIPWLSEEFGNPMSLHRFGERPRAAVEEARGHVARLLGCDPVEITFTGSGTEANHLALYGLSAPLRRRGRHLIVSAIEHPSILAPARRLARDGFELTELSVEGDGLVDLTSLADAIRPDTALISIQLANPEIGTIQPIADMARIAHARGALMHTDAVAAGGRLALDVGALGVDSLSVAANQFYGPPGIGALYVRRGVRLDPQFLGGVQEGGRRSGGHNVPAIVGMGRAAALAIDHQADWERVLRSLDRELTKGLTEIGGVRLTGHPDRRLPGHVSACLEFIEGEALVRLLGQAGIAAASGSACSDFTVSSKASHVLTALGIEPSLAQGSLVLSLGRETTREDVATVLRVLPLLVARLRALSPLAPRGPDG
ncbi:MAG: cysteine desulfurase family protein [Nitrospiria bacterium]